MESRSIASPGRRLPPDPIYTPIDKTSTIATPRCLDVVQADTTALLDEYEKGLNVTEADKALNACMVVRWDKGMALLSAYPEDILAHAARFKAKELTSRERIYWDESCTRVNWWTERHPEKQQ